MPSDAPISHATAYKILAVWSFREPTAAEAQELHRYISQQEGRGTTDALVGKPPAPRPPLALLIDQHTPRFVSELPRTIPGGVQLRGGCPSCGGGRCTFTTLTLYMPGERMPGGGTLEYPVYHGGDGTTCQQTILATDVFVVKAR